MSNDPDIRIGEPERGDALDQLSELFSKGYLDVTEFDKRTQAAVQATHRSHIDDLFADLPRREIEAAGTKDLNTDVDAELADLEDRAKKVGLADTTIWTIAIITFVVGMFIFSVSWAWLAFPLAGIGSVAARGMIGFDDHDEEIYEEISGELGEQEKEKRAERLRIAAKRRKELGH